MSALRVLLLATLEEERLKLRLLNHRRDLRAISDPLQLPGRYFQQQYRLDRECFARLCEELAPYMESRTRRHGVRKDLRILGTISFFASGSYQKQVAVDSNVGLSQSSLSEAVAEVTAALNKPEILRKYIKFPSTWEERQQKSERFMAMHSFPGVIGCIDGTHVAIVRPRADEEAYYNRKNYHSLNVLIICDADLQILHVDASFPGASHDAHVWRNCPINRHLQNLTSNEEFCWFLGDSGYTQSPWLMTPVLNTEPGSTEEYYTDRLCRVRSTVERAIGVLKARWRCLLAHRTMHYDPIKAGQITNACVVLYNICNAARLPVPHLSRRERLRDWRRQIPQEVRYNDPNAAHLFRVSLINRLWLTRQQ